MINERIFLLADDDIDDREMFCSALNTIDSNIACHTVTDGREALESLHNMPQKPQLIFLDINMPVMSGWQCLKAIKEDSRYHSIPVVVISTSSNRREIDIARDLGAVCYFTKPHQYNELIEALRVLVTSFQFEKGLPLAGVGEQKGVQYINILSASE